MSTLLTRRDTLKLGGAIALFVATPAWAGRKNSLTDDDYRGRLGAPTMFSHGLASGDPLPDGIVLWTRVSPDHGGAVDVYWEIARDESFTDRVASGTVTTTPRQDYTVTVDVRGSGPSATSDRRRSTSPRTAIDVVRQANPHLKFAEAARRGYVVLDVDASRVLAQWWLMDQVENPAGATQSVGKAFEILDGDPHLHDVDVSSPSNAFP